MENEAQQNATGKRAVDSAQNTSMFSFGGKGWFLLIYCMAIYFTCSFLVNDGLNIYVPILGEKGMDTATLYTFTTLAGWIAIPFTFIFSWILRKSTKLCMAIGLALAIVGCMIFGSCNKAWQILIILIMFWVMVNGTEFLGTSNLVANWFPTRKGAAMGWATLGTNANTAINPWLWTFLIAGLGAGAVGMAWTFRIWGVILIVLFVLLLVFIKNNPEDAGCYPDNDKSLSLDEVKHNRELGDLYRKSSPWTVGKLLSTKEVWFVAIASGIIMMITTGVVSNFIAIGMSFGYDQTGALIIMSIASVCGVVFSVIWGKVDAVMGVKWAGIVFYIIMAVAMLLWLIPSVVAYIIGAILVGCSLGAGNNLLASMTASFFGRYDFDRAWGIIYPIHVVIRSAGFALVGVISTRTGSFRMAFVVLLLCSLVAIILVACMKVRMLGRVTVDEEELKEVQAQEAEKKAKKAK